MSGICFLSLSWSPTLNHRKAKLEGSDCDVRSLAHVAGSKSAVARRAVASDAEAFLPAVTHAGPYCLEEAGHTKNPKIVFAF